MRVVFFAVLVGGVLTVAAAEGFLAASARSVSAAAVEDVLLTEIADRVSVAALKKKLLPTYVALPKNEYGQLEPATVRYALHRYFVQSFGWYVKGLEADGEAWNTNTSAVIMKDRVPAHIFGLLKTRVQAKNGLDLDGLATFAATLSELIEKDVTSCFDECYQALNAESNGVIREADLDKLLRGYLARHLFGGDDMVQSAKQLRRIEQEITRMFAGWPDAKMWLKDTRLALEWAQEPRRNPFVRFQRTRESSQAIVHDIMHQFVHVANSECPTLKNSLLELEYKGTGRVRLVDFYKSTHDNSPRESEEYLRSLGCLEEVTEGRPMLLIANYIGSRANCLVDTSYYSTCCLNECEGLLGHLERAIASPDAEPRRIAEVISRLPSDTVDAPRNLSAPLLRRLGDIAEVHNGRVPLHGRLFSQWMHHAYPRECPYPHLAGTSKQYSQDEWMDLKNLNNVFATETELKMHAERMVAWDKDEAPLTIAGELPWLNEEELVAQHKISVGASKFDFRNVMRLLMCAVGVASVAVPLTRSFKACAAPLSNPKAIHCV